MIHVGARSYKIARHKTIARAVWARALRFSELRMDQKCTPMPAKPTQMLLLVLHNSFGVDSAANAFVFGKNQVAVDQVIPLEAALDVPAAIVGRDPPSQVPDGGEAGGEHAEVAVLRNSRYAPGDRTMLLPRYFPGR